MKKILAFALVAMLAFALVPSAAVADADADRNYEMDDEADSSRTWTSDPFVGLAPTFFAGDYTCGDTGDNCETTLFAITGLTAAEIADGEAAGTPLNEIRDTVNITTGITNFSVPVSDLDIIVWQSNANGDRISELGRVGDLDTDPSEEFSGSVTVRGDKPVAYVLLEVVFFAGAGTYDGYMYAS